MSLYYLMSMVVRMKIETYEHSELKTVDLFDWGKSSL